jgi:hypothetical protein
VGDDAETPDLFHESSSFAGEAHYRGKRFCNPALAPLSRLDPPDLDPSTRSEKGFTGY